MKDQIENLLINRILTLTVEIIFYYWKRRRKKLLEDMLDYLLGLYLLKSIEEINDRKSMFGVCDLLIIMKMKRSEGVKKKTSICIEKLK